MGEKSNGAAMFQVGLVIADPKSCTLTFDGDGVKISPRAMNVLEYLSKHAGDTVTHDELLAAFWRGPISSTNAVHKTITELRQVFEDIPGSGVRIETIRKRGYRMLCEIRSISNGRVRRTALSFASRSALLMTGGQGPASEHRVVEEINRELTLRIGQVDGVSTSRLLLPDEVDYTIETNAQTIEGRFDLTFFITPAKSDLPSYVGRFEATTLKDVVALALPQIVHDLLVLLDDEHLNQMRRLGTKNVRAYLSAREGLAYQRIATLKPLTLAEERFRRAIEVDPRFGYAYCMLAAIHQQITLNAADPSTREQQRRNLQSLLLEAKTACIDEASLQAIDRVVRFASVLNAFDAERFWREELLKNPSDPDALTEYGKLLNGSKLLDESWRYFDLALSRNDLSVEARANIQTWYSAVAAARGDFEDNIRLNLAGLEGVPDLPPAIYGIVRSLAKLGRFQEAEGYVEQLFSSDASWGFGARTVLRAIRGDTPLGSPLLDKALARATKGLRGEVLLMLGDIEGAVRAWTRLESNFLRTWWVYASSNEAYYPKSVIQDSRYQAILEELGIGKTWRSYMRRQAQTLTSITGIDITTPPPPEDLAFIGT